MRGPNRGPFLPPSPLFLFRPEQASCLSAQVSHLPISDGDSITRSSTDELIFRLANFLDSHEWRLQTLLDQSSLKRNHRWGIHRYRGKQHCLPHASPQPSPIWVLGEITCANGTVDDGAGMIITCEGDFDSSRDSRKWHGWR